MSYIQVQYFEMLTFFFKGNTCRSQSLLKLYSCQRLILNLRRHHTQVQSLLPQGRLVSRALKMTFPFKWTDSDVPSLGSEGWRRQMTGFNSLKIAEGRVAFDVVLLLEAIKLSWMHIHSCQYLKIIVGKWRRLLKWRFEKSLTINLASPKLK